MNSRKINRLRDFDYSNSGYYFLTICTKNREEFFGKIENGKMILNEFGNIAKKYWMEIPIHFQNCLIDEFIIMPNHIHGILIIDNYVGNSDIGNVGNRHACSLQRRQYQYLPIIIGSYKSAVSKMLHKFSMNFGWQKSYHDHIIRDENSLYNIRQYIVNNPLNWNDDENNIN